MSKISLKETKDINVKAFNMIANKNEAKAMVEHILCVCKCTISNSNQKRNNKTCQYECKKLPYAQKRL